MWEKVRLRDVCDILNGYAFRSSEYVETNGARIIRITNVQKGRIVDNDPKLYPLDLLDSLQAFEIRDSDILMSLTGNVGRVGIFPENLRPAYLNQRVCKITPKHGVLKKYIFHYLNSDFFEQQAINASGGAAQLNLSTNWLKNHQILLPPLPVQQRIADTLDKADALRRKDQELLKKYDELAQAIFIDMFGDPVKNDKGWKLKKLGEVCSKIGSGSTPRGGKEAYKSEGISLIRSLNIHQNEFRYKDLAFIDEQQAYNLRNVVVEENDILFNITGASVCRTAIVPPNVLPARVNQHVAILRPITDQLNPQYFVRLLNNGNMNKLLYGIATQGGATREAITKEHFENLEIPVPSLTLQRFFAWKIELINQLEAKTNAEKSEKLFQSLLQKSFK